ncbi:hypothetical protein [Psychrobacter sp. 16-MNA-CIBAN-0192]|uniref:hypothetical protein n=1 Tax=Psychrobacter sp. 16-MNA-CIBAN-0192 TaxID=3140448 RepID=UPI00332EA7F5
MKVIINKTPLTQVLLFGAIAFGVSACQAPTSSSQLPSSSGSILDGASEGAKPAVSYPRNPPQLPIALPIASWMKPAIDNSQTDAVYRQEWLKAESRRLCPILALPKQSAAHLDGHTSRRANFSGGWGVAYDLPKLRSAYGVANAGTSSLDGMFNKWEYNVRYQDGSWVGYGREGGNPTGKWLAYILIPKNNCFYNVWSAQSKTHLEQMIADLRMVQN